MSRLSRPHDAFLKELLQDPERAHLYLEVAFEEFEQDGDKEMFLLALRTVAEVQGGIGALAKRTQLNREHLYKALSPKGNPRLDTVGRILRGLGYGLSVYPLTP